jgi:large repetitive protein
VALSPTGANSDADITNIIVRAVSKEVGTELTSTVSDTAFVIVDAVADQPTLDAQNVSGAEDSAVALNIVTALRDTDGSEVFTNGLLQGIPNGFTVTGAGATKLANGDWSFNPTQAGQLQLVPPANFSGTVNVTVVVNNRETATGTRSA